MKFKVNTPNLKKVNLFRLLKFLPTLTLLLLLVFFSFTVAFLYQYFYQTITEVKLVSILQNQVALNQVNIPLYQQVIKAWEIKKQFDETKLAELTDPFKPLPDQTQANSLPSLEQVNTPEY